MPEELNNNYEETLQQGYDHPHVEDALRTRDQDTRHLCDSHRAELASYGISAAILSERRYQSVSSKADLRDRGFSTGRQSTPTLLFSLYDGNTVKGYGHKPDIPRFRPGAPQCEYSASSSVILDVLPSVAARLPTADTIFVVSRVLDADALASAGADVISLISTEERARAGIPPAVTATPGWPNFPIRRTDGSAMTYVVLEGAEEQACLHQRLLNKRTQAELKRGGAHVCTISRLQSETGSIISVGEYLREHTVTELLSLANAEDDKAKDQPDKFGARPPADSVPEAIYTSGPDGIIFQSGVRITNFTAAITADIIQDDGEETDRKFQIDASQNGWDWRAVVSAPATSEAWPGSTLNSALPPLYFRKWRRMPVSRSSCYRRIYRRSGFTPTRAGATLMQIGFTCTRAGASGWLACSNGKTAFM